MQIDRLSPEMDRLVAADAKFEKIADGFAFTEGPVWDRNAGILYFSDIPNGRIHRWSESGGVTVFREPSFKSNGLTLDHQGRLVACEHVGRRVSRQEADGAVVGVATNVGGKRLNSPNDVVVKSDGAIYFTDPALGLMNDRIGAYASRELDVTGVWRVAPDGKLSLVSDDLEAPNGLAFSPDESVLYVDDTRRRHLYAFDVQGDGSVANMRLFADLQGEEPGAADGMKIDVEGNVYCTGPGGVHVFDPKGTRLGLLNMGRGPANLAWGGDDWRTLYFTFHEELWRLPMKMAGIPVGAR